MAACPEFYFGCWLGRKLFTLPICCRRCPWSCGQKRLIILVMWWRHHLLSGSLPNATFSEFHVGFRLGRKLFTLPICCPQSPWSHGLQPKRLYHTHSVAVTPAAVRFHILRPLVQVSLWLGRKLFRPPSYTYNDYRVSNSRMVSCKHKQLAS